MRDRLIELIQNSVNGCARHWAEVIAGHLLENGVVVPPCKLEQTMWCLWGDSVEECRVSGLTQKAKGDWKIRLTILRTKSVFEITPDKIGKTVFLIREEAEQALKGEQEK